jgi:hypothetical protein
LAVDVAIGLRVSVPLYYTPPSDINDLLKASGANYSSSGFQAFYLSKELVKRTSRLNLGTHQLMTKKIVPGRIPSKVKKESSITAPVGFGDIATSGTLRSTGKPKGAFSDMIT